ncbi:ABC1 kinase family protein [Cohnella hashimotonis]|uniref:AarF/ABC1/UbiB kinase family protein n=1 Tax=Cohnella hashimotonis TaxID=2826895 RepID=A0ABT6TD53_9BACL|nr:AarF/ABC1/UbiB kinase family protein [Cohnella hashimotonis]MDI4644766.1 AarF/ABC1/UbiB kinase family protein [Cohnella hashimotonis]
MNAGKRIRQLRRYRTIATALARNGFGYVSDELGLVDKLAFFRVAERKDIRTKSIGERIRLMLEELGPTFVKLGQLASTRPDLIPAPILKELELLQDQVPPFAFAEASRIIERELGAPVIDLFDRFEETPIAAASIGQVYRATLIGGTDVAVKVQRPGISAQMETDLEILADLTRLAEHRLEWARQYRLRDMVEELAKALRTELDYGAEARNGERFARMSVNWAHIEVPNVHWDYCSRRVLTTDYIEGIKLSDRMQLDAAGLPRRLLAERYASTLFEQTLVEGFFHGDPHPGNVLALPDGRLALLDFGMVGRLTPAAKRNFAAFVIALRNQSTKGVLRAIGNMGAVPEDVDEERLFADIDEMREKYYKVPFDQISMGEAVQDLFAVAFRHRIQVPAELTLLGKTMLTMEGVVSSLDPDFSVFDVAEPFGKKLLREQLSPARIARAWIEEAPEFAELIRDVPAGLRQWSKLVHKGRIRAEIEIAQVDKMTKKLNRISNRLSFSIVLLALSIIMAGLIIGAALGHAETSIWRFPIIETGFVIAALMFGWLIYAIIRSGRF